MTRSALLFVILMITSVVVQLSAQRQDQTTRTRDGRCINGISGTVTDSNGHPLSNVNVTLIKAEKDLFTTASSAEGKYSFPVAEGTYKIRFDPTSRFKSVISTEITLTCHVESHGGNSVRFVGEFKEVNISLDRSVRWRKHGKKRLDPEPRPTPINTPTPQVSPTPIISPTPIPRASPTPRILPTPRLSPAPNVSPTPTANPSPLPTRGASDWDSLQASLQDEVRQGGRLAFHAPDAMVQGEDIRVEARIASHDIGASLTEGLPTNGQMEPEGIQVSPVMKAILFSEDDAFTITSKSSEEQLITGRPFAQWEWYIRARKSGEHTIHLKIIAVVHTNDRGDKPMDIAVADKPIKIKVSYGYMLGEFFGDLSNWKYLIGSTSLVAIIAAAWKFIRDWINRRRGPGNPTGWERLDGD